MREANRYRDVSPPRCQAEQPRRVHDARFDFSDHRSVSPLGSSRFERSYERPRRFASSGNGTDSNSVRSSATVREVHEVPQFGYDGYYGASDTTAAPRSATGQEAREVPRFGYDGYYGNSSVTSSQDHDVGGLSRSNKARGRMNERGYSTTGYSGGASDARYEQDRRNRLYDSNFSRGGLSSWESY